MNQSRISLAASAAVWILLLTGCSSWSDRVVDRSENFPSPDGQHEVLAEYTLARGFMGNPNVTWILVRKTGGPSHERDAVLAVDSTAVRVNVTWTSNLAAQLEVYGPTTRSVRPLLYPNRSGIRLTIDLVETTGTRRLLE